jgi:energy-converting hydrogenase Eha subunit E
LSPDLLGDPQAEHACHEWLSLIIRGVIPVVSFPGFSPGVLSGVNPDVPGTGLSPVFNWHQGLILMHFIPVVHSDQAKTGDFCQLDQLLPSSYDSGLWTGGKETDSVNGILPGVNTLLPALPRGLIRPRRAVVLSRVSLLSRKTALISSF